MQAIQTTELKRFDFFSLRDFSAAPEEKVAMPVVPEIKEEAPPPPPPPPTFSEKDLELAKATARNEAYQLGLEEGTQRVAKADADREAQLISIMKQACERISQFHATYNQHVVEQQEVLTRLAIAVAKHVAGAAMKQSPEVPVSQMVAECLPLLLGEPRIVITIHPAIITLMKQRLEEVGRQAGYDGTLLLEADDTLSPTDCHIQWQGGSAHTSYAEIWRNIEEKLVQTPAQDTGGF